MHGIVTSSPGKKLSPVSFFILDLFFFRVQSPELLLFEFICGVASSINPYNGKAKDEDQAYAYVGGV
jgi:hypothetical protein